MDARLTAVAVAMATLLGCTDPAGFGDRGTETCAPECPDTTRYQVTDSVIAYYAQAVNQLAVQQMNSGTRPDSLAVEIPAGLVDTIFRAITSIHRSSLPARDSVVALYPTLPKFISLRSLDLVLDTSVAWCQHLLTDTTVADSAMRAVMRRYGLHAGTASTGAFSALWSLNADTFLNIDALRKEIARTVDGVTLTMPPLAPGDGSSIDMSRGVALWDIQYVYRWGDCPAGCLYGHEWRFEVRDDGLVRFLGSSGDAMPAGPIP